MIFITSNAASNSWLKKVTVFLESLYFMMFKLLQLQQRINMAFSKPF